MPLRRYWDKIRYLHGRHGFAYVLGFLASRLIYRRVARVVYEYDLADPPASVESPPEEEVIVYDSHNIASVPAELWEFLGHEAVADYVANIPNGDLLFVVREGYEYSHSGFVLFTTPQARIIGEKDQVPIVANCYTAPAWRGKGIYRRALIFAMHHLRRLGCRRVVIETEIANVASQKGIEAAGFRLVRRMVGAILFHKLAIQSITANGRKRWSASWV
jgi:GNAT superfamily N-acetyltransferase